MQVAGIRDRTSERFARADHTSVLDTRRQIAVIRFGDYRFLFRHANRQHVGPGAETCFHSGTRRNHIVVTGLRNRQAQERVQRPCADLAARIVIFRQQIEYLIREEQVAVQFAAVGKHPDHEFGPGSNFQAVNLGVGAVFDRPGNRLTENHIAHEIDTFFDLDRLIGRNRVGHIGIGGATAANQP